MSVLVVDDNEDYRFLIGRKLGESGIAVAEAASGDEALELLDGVEVVLLDYKLPGRDGIETLRLIRERDTPPSVVMVTGMGSESVVVEAMRAGATDYVVKDGSYLSVLPAVVERVLRLRELDRREAHQRELERQLVKELQETLDLRRQLVASVSHELRTPLTSIYGFSSTLLLHWDALDDAEKQRIVGRVRSNSQDLSDLVERLLDFSYIESGRLRPELTVVDLRSEVEGAVDALSSTLSDSEVAIEVGDGIAVRADSALLRRTLWNLLTNAVKYGGSPGSITIRACSTAGGFARVEVADRGPGMDEDDAARAFEPFWRGSETRMGKRGTGIGLALVRDYVRLMGGDVGVTSTPGDGATFWFTIPVSALRPSGAA